MKSIAIITARGGSKRIPRKNIKLFMGKPMIAFAIEAALKSCIFDTVMVSTDDHEIANIAKKYGAEVPFTRSEKTASDYATTFDVLEEVLNKYTEAELYFDTMCCIYPCVPFLSAETLKEAYTVFLSTQCDAIQPVCKYPVPIEWAMRLKNGVLVPEDAAAQKIRSQDLQPAYHGVGMFYFCKTKILLQEKTLVPKKTAAYIINELDCQDIDTLDDWNLAEKKYKLRDV